MKDQLIKLHDDFVSKGMPPSNINIIFLLKNASRIHNRNIGYVLLDMQTWLREEHGIDLWIDSCLDNQYHVEDITKNDKFGLTLGCGKPSKDYNEALLFGLQEAITLIE